jgi:hypothetical protein
MIRKSGDRFSETSRAKDDSPKPLQVLEKLYELAGNTNVTKVTEKGGGRAV